MEENKNSIIMKGHHIQSTSQQWKRQPSLSSSSTSTSTSSSSSSFESITAQGDAIEAITSDFQWLKVAAESQQSWSDDDDTDSPLVVTKADRRNKNNTTDAEQPQHTYNLNSRHQGIGTRRDVSSSSSISSSSSASSSVNSLGRRNKIRRRPEDSEYQLKNSLDALVGSISAAINFCRHAGVPKPSISQLERNLKMKRYFAVMNRIQHYIGCVQSESVDEMLAKVHLAVTAWESMCRYESLEYKRAYKYVYRLRDANGDSSSTASSSSSSSPTTQTASESEIQRAIQLQIKLAEQCTACRKNLYLVHRWQRQILQMQMQRFKKASTSIEPSEGCQAIRCL